MFKIGYTNLDDAFRIYGYYTIWKDGVRFDDVEYDTQQEATAVVKQQLIAANKAKQRNND